MGGTAGATKPGNTLLVNYGIHSEQSDVRAHVSVVGKCVYVYKTCDGISVISSRDYRKATASTGDIITAEGYLVPPSHIKDIKTVDVPDHIMQKAEFSKLDSTTIKGEKAVRVVKWLLKSGKFPLRAVSKEITDLDMQISGTDILVELKTKIQVKCDWSCGDRAGCTGNLFLQVKECNPNGRH